jgi:hypothetical protein
MTAKYPRPEVISFDHAVRQRFSASIARDLEMLETTLHHVTQWMIDGIADMTASDRQVIVEELVKHVAPIKRTLRLRQQVQDTLDRGDLDDFVSLRDEIMRLLLVRKLPNPPSTSCQVVDFNQHEGPVDRQTNRIPDAN